MKKQLQTILTAVILVFAANVAINAATFTVTNLNDADVGSLRQAITDANDNPGPDVINVMVTGTLLLTEGLPSISDSVSINGGSQTGFIINGQGIAALRPINVNGVGIVVSIRDLTITGGNTTSQGGGIRVDGGSIATMTNVTVTGNNGTGGAGINVATDSTLYLIDSLVINNTVTTDGGDGGGINVTSSKLFMLGTTVSGNVVPLLGSTSGGGINIVTSSAAGSPVSFVRIENSTFNNNSARLGGGIYLSGGGSLQMSNSTISNNSTAGTDSETKNGGGIYLNLGTATIRNSTIAGNTATGTGAGGGIYSTGAGTALLANSIVADNTAGTTASAEIRGTTTSGGAFNTQGVNIIEGTTSGTLNVINGMNITGVDPQLSTLANNGGKVQTQAITTASNAYNAGLNSEALDTQDFPLTVDGRGIGYSRIDVGTVDVGAFEFTTTPQRNKTNFDFDGDGRADIGVYRPTEGNWYRQNGGANNISATTSFGLLTDQLAPADYDGDGKTDIAVFRDGVWYILLSATGQVNIISYGLSGDIPTPGDFDGDGRADIGVFRPSSGTWFYIRSSDEETAGIEFGLAGDAPIVGDYDGDGKTDITIFRPSEGVWYYLQSSNNQLVIEPFGLSGDIPLSGDFNGDGKTELAVFRPSTGVWYSARTTGIPAQNFESTQFGISTDIPTAADFDGDGKTDIAVFRPSNGVWYILQSSNSSVNYASYGLNGDRPLPSAYLPTVAPPTLHNNKSK